ncbi:Na/Pi symporter [Paraliobacillus sediminis]|uniref:Na/Pi symporter n=1 Tax=Paraliobacillus sediminis TaxID=1885916 RepID=UPI000E3B8D96|nr:Na/Pi symporter [Paraliobacillus sediminis]
MGLLSLLSVFLLLFYMGMRLLQTGLTFFMSSKIEAWLTKGTQNIFGSILIGMIATFFLQSSSVVLVITISFVTIGAISFRQTIGIILGANIGTTITGEILVFGDAFPFLIWLVIGVFMLLFPQKNIFYSGCILVGLSTIFVSLDGFESLATLVATNHLLLAGLSLTDTTPSIGIVIGTVISGIIQSSSATFGLTLSMMEQQLLSLSSAIAIILGSNIGTCITSLIATIGAKREAKLVALTHTAFNLITVVIAIPLLPLINLIALQLANESSMQLAHISVLFNLFSVLIVLPFIPLFEKYVAR